MGYHRETCISVTLGGIGALVFRGSQPLSKATEIRGVGRAAGFAAEWQSCSGADWEAASTLWLILGTVENDVMSFQLWAYHCSLTEHEARQVICNGFLPDYSGRWHDRFVICLHFILPDFIISVPVDDEQIQEAFRMSCQPPGFGSFHFVHCRVGCVGIE